MGHQVQTENIDQQGNMSVFTFGCIKKDNLTANSHQLFIFKLHRCRMSVDKMLPLFETSQIRNWLEHCTLTTSVSNNLDNLQCFREREVYF